MKIINGLICSILIGALVTFSLPSSAQSNSATVNIAFTPQQEKELLTEVKDAIKETINAELNQRITYHSAKETGQSYYVVQKIPISGKIDDQQTVSIGYIKGGTPVYCSPPAYNCAPSGQLVNTVKLKNITVIGDLKDTSNWMAICQIDNTDVFSGSSDGSSDYFTLPVYIDPDWNINITVQ